MNDTGNIFTFLLPPIGSIWIVNFNANIYSMSSNADKVSKFALFICKGKLDEGEVDTVNEYIPDKLATFNTYSCPFYQNYESFDLSKYQRISGCTVITSCLFQTDYPHYTFGYDFETSATTRDLTIGSCELVATRIA